ncbi:MULTISPECIES: dolichyl-phosphate beta-glucosyltransferase [Rudanella]|uniref:dolichyl-phosphate beta-glucosyltransferase n=1 Tax=Rudanella TaxID=451373 RepID=UPI0003605BFD|nr:MULTISPECIES: dolichyl-phosphate beta-glucosyltransferase [Rudanella]
MTAIIIPCYNEATRLPVADFEAYWQQYPEVRFCFVDDGSTDQTRALLERLQAEHPAQVEALILPQNRGKAGAVRAGMLHVAEQGQADFVGFLDADLATPLAAIQDLEARMSPQPELDLVMGSRIKFLGTDIRRNPFRHYAGRVVATFISNILKLGVYDTQCGAKLFRRETIAGLFGEPFLSPWLFDVEILARLIRQYGRDGIRARVVEMPLRQWIEKDESRIKMSYYLKLWFELYRIGQAYK